MLCFAHFYIDLALFRSVGYSESMISQEPGILQGSHYFYITPTETAKELYYYLVWCGHYFCKRGYSIKREFYPPLLIAYIQKGILNLQYGGEMYQAEEGEVVLIDCRNPHHYYSSPGLEFSYFHFDGANSHEFCGHLIEEQGSPVFRTSANTGIGVVINETVQRYKNEEVLSPLEVSGIIYDLIIQLARGRESLTEHSHVVDRAVKFINDQTGKNLSLDEIADQVNLSPYYFSRLFKKYTGFSPLDYALNCKIDRAIYLLKSTGSSVGEIAYQLGYGSEAAFGNAFKRKTGIPPGRFRKMTI